MKSRYYILLILLSLTLLTLHAQNETPKSVIELDQVNMLYAGLENPLTIAIPGVSSENMIVKCSAGTLTGENGKYVFYISDTVQFPPEVELSIYLKEEDALQFIGSKNYRLWQIPEPRIYFGSKTGEADDYNNEVRMVNFILARLDDFPFYVSFRVTEFQMIYVPQQGKSTTFKSMSPSLTPQMKAALSNPKPGDKIIITEVWYNAPGPRTRKYKGSIVITEK